MSSLSPPFRLIQRNGIILTFDDLVSLARATRAAGIEIAKHHVDHRTLQDWRQMPASRVTYNEWVVRDDHGAIVTNLMVHPPRDHSRFMARWFADVRHAERLGLPIPRTGRRVRGYVKVLRHPRHHGVNAARAATSREAARDHEDGPLRQARPKGRIKPLPTSWDDQPRSDYGHRSWKRHRRTRWRRVRCMAPDPTWLRHSAAPAAGLLTGDSPMLDRSGDEAC